ncbi:MAG: hypothetical protein J0647_04380, partial [Campylobacteraceae bacterium]|nr:hypothetical protein [Campylobacteraceae bacterium]
YDIASQVYSDMDTGFWNGTHYSILEDGKTVGVTGLSVGLMYFLVWLLVFLLLNRRNDYSYGYYVRQETNIILSIVITYFGFLYLFPTPTSEAPVKLTNEMSYKAANAMIDELKSQTDPKIKLKEIDDFTDSSGKVYYLVYELDANKKCDALLNDKPVKHHYIGESHQGDYVKLINGLEEQYRNGNKKDLGTASFLADIFKNGNRFVNRNKKKGSYFDSERKAFIAKQKQIEKKKLEVVTPEKIKPKDV